MREHEKELKQDIGIIYDTCHYNEKFKVKDVGKMMSLVYQNWDQDKYLEYIERFQLPKQKTLDKFSKGMKMKLCFAAELAHQPKLLILDEATSGLDPIVRDEILEILQEFIMDEEHGVLISSHITSDLDKIADYITFIHNGEILLAKHMMKFIMIMVLSDVVKKIFEALPKDEILAYKKEEFEYKVLVANRQDFEKFIRML